MLPKQLGHQNMEMNTKMCPEMRFTVVLMTTMACNIVMLRCVCVQTSLLTSIKYPLQVSIDVVGGEEVKEWQETTVRSFTPLAGLFLFFGILAAMCALLCSESSML